MGTTLACVVAAIPAAGQIDPPAVRPVVAATGGAWTEAIDVFLETSDPMTIVPLMHLSPAALRDQARQARETWRSSARAARSGPDAARLRRQALARIQAAARAPMEVLLPLSGLRSPTPEWDAFEDVAVAAWEAVPELTRLHLETIEGDRRARDAERMRLARFTTWWQVAYLQYLLNTGRMSDFNRIVSRFDVDDNAEPRVRAEYAFLRGLANERAARLSENRQPGAKLVAPGPGARSTAAFDALSYAQTWYRRALKAAPEQTETQLHLGRVLLELRKPAEAVTVLAPLASERCQGVHCATAWLFLGEAREALGEADKAGQAYARASSVLGVRQSALLAMMHLAIRRGDVNAALAVSGQLAATSPLANVELPDAWSLYVGGRRLDGEAVLAPLRDTQVR